MPTSRGHRRAVAVTNLRGDRTVATNIRRATSVELDALCKSENTTKSALLRHLIEQHVHLEGHRGTE